MSKKSKRIAMILVGVVMALLALAQHFGWIAGPPPLLAPGTLTDFGGRLAATVSPWRPEAVFSGVFIQTKNGLLA